MEDGDKLAIATLAAARCAALGLHEVDDYLVQYDEFERRFEQKRQAQAQQRTADRKGNWNKLGGS